MKWILFGVMFVVGHVVMAFVIYKTLTKAPVKYKKLIHGGSDSVLAVFSAGMSLLIY
jgi:hypothetical protein